MPINERASSAPAYLKPETWFLVGALALAAYYVLVLRDGARYFKR